MADRRAAPRTLVHLLDEAAARLDQRDDDWAEVPHLAQSLPDPAAAVEVDWRRSAPIASAEPPGPCTRPPPNRTGG